MLLLYSCTITIDVLFADPFSMLLSVQRNIFLSNVYHLKLYTNLDYHCGFSFPAFQSLSSYFGMSCLLSLLLYLTCGTPILFLLVRPVQFSISGEILLVYLIIVVPVG